jgi:hypothetical protein
MSAIPYIVLSCAKKDNVRNGRHRQKSEEKTIETHINGKTEAKEEVNKVRMKNIEGMVGKNISK